MTALKLWLRLDCKQLLLTCTIDQLLFNIRLRIFQALRSLQCAFALASILLENRECVEIRPLANLIVFLLVFNLVASVPQISHRTTHEVRSTFLVKLVSLVILLLLLVLKGRNRTFIVGVILIISGTKVLILKLLASKGILRIVIANQIFEGLHTNF